MQTKNIAQLNEKKLQILVDQLVEQDWAVCDNLLSEEDFENLYSNLTELDQKQAFQPAQIGTHGDKKRVDTIRNDRTLWIDSDTENVAQKKYIHFLKDFQTELNQQLYLGIQSMENHFAIYEKGGFYKKHLDQAKNSNSRVISCLFYLNKQWQPEDGGDLILYNPHNPNELMKTISPIANRFACFLSDRIFHEVSPSYKQRKSIAGWLRRDI